MRQQRPHPIICTLVLFILIAAAGCGRSAGHAAPENSAVSERAYVWTKVIDHAPFPEAYNFPLFNIRNTMWAFSGEGNWYSPDGKTWTKAELPPLGLRTGYQQYVQFGEAIYALGTMEGNYLDLKLGSRIAKTSSDLKKWETIAEQSELPPRVFYGAVVFAGKIWMLGGFDGQTYYHDVWNSSDGIKWRRVTNKTPWSPRSNPLVFVFQNKLWLLGGGIIDGQVFNDVWSTTDGVEWQRATDKLSERPISGGSLVAFDGKIWIVGLNRNDGFQNAVMVSRNGVDWIEEKAPWTPRGGVATCVLGDKLFMTGGKYSVTENGTIKFIYSNDVWYLSSK